MLLGAGLIAAWPLHMQVKPLMYMTYNKAKAAVPLRLTTIQLLHQMVFTMQQPMS